MEGRIFVGGRVYLMRYGGRVDPSISIRRISATALKSHTCQSTLPRGSATERC